MLITSLHLQILALSLFQTISLIFGEVNLSRRLFALRKSHSRFERHRRQLSPTRVVLARRLNSIPRRHACRVKCNCYYDARKHGAAQVGTM